jgi:hypothetical protein
VTQLLTLTEMKLSFSFVVTSYPKIICRFHSFGFIINKFSGSPTKCQSNKRRKDKMPNDKTSNGTQCRMTKCQMIQNVERTKC